jgi:hypothetical protein
MHLAECVSAATCSGVRVIWSLASTGACATPGPPPSRSSRAHFTASCLQARWSSRADISWSSTLEASEPLRMRPRASFLKPSSAVSRSAVLSSTTARQKFSCFTRSMLPLVPAPPALSPEHCKLKPKNFQTLTDEQIPSILDCRSTDVAHKPPVSTFKAQTIATETNPRAKTSRRDKVFPKSVPVLLLRPHGQITRNTTHPELDDISGHGQLNESPRRDVTRDCQTTKLARHAKDFLESIHPPTRLGNSHCRISEPEMKTKFP